MLDRYDKDKVQTSIDSISRLVSLVSRDSQSFKNMVVTHEQRLLKLEKDVDEDRKMNDIALSDLDTALQKERDAIMEEFRSGSSRVLIATDVWGRGLDVQQVSLVINYDLPTNRENYIHRIGRGGRFGRKGVAINFLTAEDQRTLQDIEQFYNTQIEEMPMNVADLI